jgi:hypothetical protein
MDTYVSEDHAASIFRVHFNPEDEAVQSSGIQPLCYMAQQNRKPQILSSPS